MANPKTDRTKETEVIRVRGDVYDRIAEMAGPEERSLGGQVAILTKMACTHPLENREERIMTVSPVLKHGNKVAQLGEGQLVRGFFLRQVWSAGGEPDQQQRRDDLDP